MFYFRVTTDGENPKILVNGENKNYFPFTEPQYVTYSVKSYGETKSGRVYVTDNTDLFVCFHKPSDSGQGGDIPDYSEASGEFLTNDGEQLLWGDVPDKTYTNENPVPIPVGGVEPGTTFDEVPYNEMFTNILYPYAKPYARLSLNPPTDGIREIGTQIPFPIELSGTVAFSKSDSLSIIFKREDEVIYTVENPQREPKTYTYGYTDMQNPIEDDTTFFLVASDGKNTTTVSKKYEFEYPYFYGCLNVGTPTEHLVLTLNKGVIKNGNIELPVTADDNYPCFAFPTSWGEVKAIKDPNSFNVTKSFNKDVLNLTMLDGKSISFNVFTLKTQTTVEDYGFTFIFAEG